MTDFKSRRKGIVFLSIIIFAIVLYVSVDFGYGTSGFFNARTESQTDSKPSTVGEKSWTAQNRASTNELKPEKGTETSDPPASYESIQTLQEEVALLDAQNAMNLNAIDKQVKAVDDALANLDAQSHALSQSIGNTPTVLQTEQTALQPKITQPDLDHSVGTKAAAQQSGLTESEIESWELVSSGKVEKFMGGEFVIGDSEVEYIILYQDSSKIQKQTGITKSTVKL